MFSSIGLPSSDSDIRVLVYKSEKKTHKSYIEDLKIQRSNNYPFEINKGK